MPFSHLAKTLAGLLQDAMQQAFPLRQRLAPLLALLLPLAYFYRFILPVFAPAARRIGNDFPTLYLKYKVYLLDCLCHGSFPWWSPAESCGFPFYASPYTQSFYPLNLPLALYAALTGGWTRLDHQVYTVLGVGLCALGLYAWLRSLGFRLLPALGTALCLGLSYRMADILRFPNAVHSAAWYPWILWGMTLILVRGRAKSGFVLLALSLVMLLTAGYPYYVYYAIFLIPPYALLLSLPSIRGLAKAAPVRLGRAWAATAAAFVFAGLACAPYIYKIRWMLAQTTDRTGTSPGWSGQGDESLLDAAASLVYPPSALTEGWFYFGQAAFLAMAVYLMTLRRSGRPGEKALALCCLGWFALVTSVALGPDSPVFVLLNRVLPGFGQLREWSRLNIVLMAPMALLLCPALTRLFDGLMDSSARPGPDAHPDAPRLRRGLGRLYAVVLAFQLVLFLGGFFNNQWIGFHRHGLYSEVHYILAGLAAFLALRWMLGRLGRGMPAKAAAAAMAGLLLLNLADMGLLGAGFWSRRHSAELDRGVTLAASVADMDAGSLTQPRINTYDTISLSERFNTGIAINWYYQRYTALHMAHFWPGQGDYAPFESVPDDPEAKALARLLGLADGRRLYFTRSLDHDGPSAFMQDADLWQEHLTMIRPERYTGDELVLAAACDRPGRLTFVDNWDPDWTVTVDGADRPLEPALGTFKSVALEPGEHTVIFCYCPFSSELRQARQGSKTPWP